jgi:hypothetical protein
MLVVFVLTTLVKKSKKSKESFAQVLCANEWSFVQVLKNNSRSYLGARKNMYRGFWSKTNVVVDIRS